MAQDANQGSMKTVDCLLEDANWAVEDLAERANLTNDRAEAIALGRWTPSPSERQRIAAAFEVSMEDVSWGHTMDPQRPLSAIRIQRC